MSRKDKLVERLKQRPRDFTWSELERLLSSMGYAERKKGKTGGSRRKFVHEIAPVIALHKPHPGEILKTYQVDQVLETLEKAGLL